MNRSNIRTVNGAKHSGHLEIRYRLAQNRAAAVLDIWTQNEDEESLDIIAHLHRLSIEQIKKDYFGDPLDIKRRFGIKSSTKLERTLTKCLKEINEGVNHALVAVANHVPFVLLCSAEDNRNMKEVATKFLNDVRKKLNTKDPETVAMDDDNSIERCSTQKLLNASPLRAIDNQRNITNSALEKEQSSSTRSFHPTKSFSQYDLKMSWKILNTHGVGLNNHNEYGESKNICYINSIIQSLANTPTFVEWLLDNYSPDHCQLMAANKFCSICILHRVISNIHPKLNNKYHLIRADSDATAEKFAQNIEELSTTFTFGQQEDPSEFLVFLLDHLTSCLKANETAIDMNSFKTPIQHLFGLYIRSTIKCKICSNEPPPVDTWESILCLPIAAYSSLIESLSSYFNIEELQDDNLYDCCHCRKQVPAWKHLKIIKQSPIIFFHIKRFNYDSMRQMIRKIDKAITYPEILTLDSYVDETYVESNKENDESHSFVYQLNSVVVHLGEQANSGHIFCYIRSPDGNWYKADDELIKPVKLDIIFNDKDAYILCYTKILKNSIVLSDIQPMSSLRLASNIFSSTPIRSNEIVDRMNDNRTVATLLPENTTNICISSDDDMEQDPINNNLFSNEYSSIVNNNVSSSDDSIQECLSQHEKTPLSSTTDTTSIQLNENVQDSQIVDDFVAVLPASHQFTLRPVDLAKLLVIRTEKLKNKKDHLLQKMGLSDNMSIHATSNKIFISKQNNVSCTNIGESVDSESSIMHSETKSKKKNNVDVSYFYILLPYIKQLNKYCGLCVRNCTFGATNAAHRRLMHCKLRCSGQPICPFICSIIVQNSGTGHIIVMNRNIRHKQGIKICRPIRAPIRSLMKKQFAQGASVYRMYQEKLQQRTPEQREGRNYDNVGRSRCILSKIKSEGVLDSLLAPDVDQSLSKLLDKFRTEVNPDGKVKGAIQFISRYPSQVIVYSESSIRLFDTLLKQKNVIVSWDATGSIIKEKNSNRLLYYELSVTLPGVVNQDSIVPITFMVSNAHGLVDIIHWISLFKHSYCQVFPSRTFPQPRIVLSDRAQVFLIASLRVWNNENMNDFLQRSYRIVTGHASKSDLSKTNIHACLSHVLLDTRKTINKYISNSFRNLAMWSIALLINTSTWNDFLHNWKLICIVFIELHMGQQHINKEHQESLIHKISKIKNDTNISNAIKFMDKISDDNTSESYCPNIYDFHDSDDEPDGEFFSHASKSVKKKRTIDEEQQVNSTDSPFKSSIIKIFADIIQVHGVSMTEVNDKTSYGILKWFKYLLNFFMPTLPIWSNLLLGNLNRHSRQMVYSFETFIVNNEELRTTAISERRMGIVKRNQLGGEIHLRLDILMSILIPDMLSMIDEYWNVLLSYRTTSMDSFNNSHTLIIDEQRLKPIEEHWRERVSKRGTGHYTKGPDDPIIIDLLSCLLSPQVNINQNLKLPFVSPNWLDVAIGMLLSVGDIVSYPRPHTALTTNSSYLLSQISKFLEKWFKSPTSIKSINFDTAALNDKINQPLEQSTFILENILIPLLPCDIIIDKIHICNKCNLTKTLRSSITSICINSSSIGVNLERDLLAFFSPTQSDILCSKCNTATIRHIEVQKWPQVLLLNINGLKKNIKYKKPPSMFSLPQFNSWINIGCPSSSIYHLVCFNSIIKIGETETMVRSTRVKKSWRTNIHKNSIGEGEQLQRIYAHSRILVLERIFVSKTFNLVSAIAQCTLGKLPCVINQLPQCSNIQEAFNVLETHPSLIDFKNALTANIKTKFSCFSCDQVPDSLEEQRCQIFVFKSTFSNELIGYPVVLKINDQNNYKKYCSNCTYVSDNIVLNVHKQIFIKYPYYLIRCIDKNSLICNVLNTEVQLNNNENTTYHYLPIAALLLSRYNDRATVIKQESGVYTKYSGGCYTKSSSISNSEIADLLDTSASILVFYRQSHTTLPPTTTTTATSTTTDNTDTASQMRIISQANINGTKRIIIQHNNMFFAITADTTTNQINQHQKLNKI